MKKRIFSVGHIHPHRDWMRIIAVFTILVLVVVGWSFYLFQISQTDINTDIAPEIQSNAVGKTSNIDSVIGFFDARAKKVSSSTQEHFVDPSI